ncbi:MAG: phospholipase D-like domain-containing protein [Wenzhouxiangellaceae bacterium]
MPLSDASAKAIVDGWAAQSAAAFPAAEAQSMADLLARLSAAIVPHIAEDVPLTDAERQAFFTSRTVAFAEDWLAMAAAPLRRSFDAEPAWHGSATSEPATGLRSATHAELVALPVLGEKLARDVARFLARRPDATLDDLQEVNGIGPAGVRALREVAYIDRPRPGLTSPALAAFAAAPGIVTLIRVFETSDATIHYGDALTVPRRLESGAAASTAERLADVLATLVSVAEAASFPAGGVLASEAKAWLQRHRLYDDLLAGAMPGKGELLVNSEYVASVRSAIESAQSSVCVMMFLGTSSRPIDGGVGPETLVAALEAVAQTVEVRVILDQDDGGEPYLSAIINRPLFDRLKAAGIPIKFDDKDVLLHSKVVVIDRKTVIVGSHNWTRSGFNLTHEISVFAEQPDTAEAFQARFDDLWSELPDI